MDLVILAAGGSTRFGRPKQTEPIDNNGNPIMAYSCYDAIQAGIDSIIFVCKEEHRDIIESTIGEKINDKVKVSYVYQDTKQFVPDKYSDNSREKPWGTAHALLCAKDCVEGPFAMINADDFYGKQTFKIMAGILKNIKDDQIGAIPYSVEKTLSENGAVKRGIINEEEKGLSITECSIGKVNDVIIAKPLNKEDGDARVIPEGTLVSMNVFCFPHNFMDALGKGFLDFLDKYYDSETKEFLIPEFVSTLISSGKMSAVLQNTPEIWKGMTFPGDKPDVEESIRQLVENGEYPEDLWCPSSSKEDEELGFESEEDCLIDDTCDPNKTNVINQPQTPQA